MDFVVGPKDGFSEKIAEYLNAEFCMVERKHFPDHEVCPRIMHELSGDVLLVTRSKSAADYHPNTYLMEYYFLVQNIASQNVNSLNLLMPWLVYSRQDKVFRRGEPASAKSVLGLLKKAGADKFFTVSSHMQREEGKLEFYPNLESYTISAYDEIGSYLKSNYDFVNPLVIGPDFTSGYEAAIVAKSLGAETTSLKKTRDVNTGKIETGEIDINVLGRDIIIVDDVAATGGTLKNAIQEVKAKGANKVVCAVVHPVLAGNCLDRVRSTGADFLACNTLESSISKIHVEKKVAEFIKKH